MTNRLRFGINRDFAPFSRSVDGKMSGLVVDRVVSALGAGAARFDWLELDLPDMMPALAAGEADILCGVGASDERVRAFDLSDPIVTTGGAGFARFDDTIWDLDAGPEAWAQSGARVVSPAAGPLLAPLKETPGLRAADGADYSTSLTMVLDGSADIAALNFHVAADMISSGWQDRFRLPRRPYREIPLVAASLKGRNRKLLSDLNLGLSKAAPQPTPDS